MSADAARVLAAFRPGSTIYVQGGVGEPLALREVLAADPEVLAGVTLTGCAIPGMNEFDYAGLHPRARFVTFMLPGAWRSSFQAGRVIVRPASYSQIAAAFLSDPPVDLAILQVTPPDVDGLCSFGPCSDFAPLVWRRARRRLAFVNANLPRAARGPTIPFSAIDEAIEIDGPYITAEETSAGGEQAIIAGRLVDLIPDGASIQTGIGGAPAAALMGLGDRRGLVIRSGHGDAGLPGSGGSRSAGAGRPRHRPGPGTGRLRALGDGDHPLRRCHDHPRRRVTARAPSACMQSIPRWRSTCSARPMSSGAAGCCPAAWAARPISPAPRGVRPAGGRSWLCRRAPRAGQCRASSPGSRFRPSPSRATTPIWWSPNTASPTCAAPRSTTAPKP